MSGNDTNSIIPYPWIAIVGPTAIGKTSFSIFLAERIGGEIVNFDSVQMYRYLNIGSAKPSEENCKMVPHHLIDILYPDEYFDAADFIKKCVSVCRSIQQRGKVPILVGGTGFYLKALEHGLSPMPKANIALRRWLDGLEKAIGNGILFKYLKNIDPDAANRVSPNDSFRIKRLLEVFITTGNPASVIFNSSPPRPLHNTNFLKIGLIMDRAALYKRIDKRVELMFKQGIIEEVKGILNMGYSPMLPSLQSIGYKQAIGVVKGEKDINIAMYETKRDTRRYAKRQLTWFKKDVTIRWLNTCYLKDIDKAMHKLLFR